MKVATLVSCLYTVELFASANAVSIFSPSELSRRDPEHAVWQRSELADTKVFKREQTLERRRGGGGGGGGRGGGGGGGGGGSSSSSGSSGGGSSGSSGSSGGSGSRGSGSGGSSSSGSSSSGSRGSNPGSNFGGTSPGGSGKPPSIPSGGGKSVYSGGASVPYTAGRRSPLGIAPFLLPIAFLSFWPGLWLASSVYSYHWHNPITYFNRTLNQNQTLPVQCLCTENSVCGCEDNTNATYIQALLALNQSNTTHIANVNGTLTLFINGTLPNGTTAAGGTSSAPVGANAHFGWIWMVLLVTYMAFAL